MKSTNFYTIKFVKLVFKAYLCFYKNIYHANIKFQPKKIATIFRIKE